MKNQTQRDIDAKRNLPQKIRGSERSNLRKNLLTYLPANLLTLKRKFGFTLAEVLITLVIIGIAAALTMPALIVNYKKMVLKKQFKKSYSILSQALLKSEADLGYTPECYYAASSMTGSLSGSRVTDECSVLSENMLRNLNILKKCDNNAYPACIPKYKGVDTMAAERQPDLSRDEALLQDVSGIPGFYEQRILYNNSAYVLNDGSIILFYCNTNCFPRIFAIDINGKKAPNKWGYDLFSFWVVRIENSNLMLRGTNYYVETDGQTTSAMIKSFSN